MAGSNQQLLEAIVGLADSIARSSPDCAERAMQIVKLVGDLERRDPDATTVQEAIEAETDGDLSDAQVRKTAASVVRAMRDS